VEQGWIHWLGHARLWGGAAEAMRGNPEQGLAAMCEARALAEQAGERSGATHYDTVVSEALVRAGRLDEAAERIAATKLNMRTADEYAFEADLLRVEGELARSRGDAADAGALFMQAFESASGRHALSYRLRAALSLARLHPDDEAKARLRAVLAEFTEGFDTADLRAARAVIGEGTAASLSSGGNI
jgi:ATP/maltotriose-dependent transcriptional regulator MalT